MKKTAVTIIVLFAACVIALICILYFRGNGQDKDAPTFEEVTDTDGMDTGIPIRDGEPDEASEDLAEHLTEQSPICLHCGLLAIDETKSGGLSVERVS